MTRKGRLPAVYLHEVGRQAGMFADYFLLFPKVSVLLETAIRKVQNYTSDKLLFPLELTIYSPYP